MRFLARLNQYLLIMGIPGLLVISFLDSAAVPMPGGPDAVILLLAWRRPAMIYLIVLAATIGSMLGCLILYGIGRKGGEKALARFNPGKIAWIERKMQEYGTLAVIAAVLAPPPFPTKPVILMAGMLRTGIPWRKVWRQSSTSVEGPLSDHLPHSDWRNPAVCPDPKIARQDDVRQHLTVLGLHFRHVQKLSHRHYLPIIDKGFFWALSSERYRKLVAERPEVQTNLRELFRWWRRTSRSGN